MREEAKVSMNVWEDAAGRNRAEGAAWAVFKVNWPPPPPEHRSKFVHDLECQAEANACPTLEADGQSAGGSR